jgi:hypothetical protein
VFFEKVTVPQSVKNFPSYGTWKFVTLFARVRHFSLFWDRRIQSAPVYYISLRYTSISSTHRLGLPINYSGSLTKNMNVFLIFSKCVKIKSSQEYVTDGISALQELHSNLCYVAWEPITDHLRKNLQKLNELWNVQRTLTRAETLTVGSTIVSLYIHDGNYIKSIVLYCLQWILVLALTNYVLRHICI